MVKKEYELVRVGGKWHPPDSCTDRCEHIRWEMVEKKINEQLE